MKSLEGLQKLQTLMLFGVPIGDAGVKHLKGLKHLQLLELTNTRVTSAGLKELKAALPEVVILQNKPMWPF